MYYNNPYFDISSIFYSVLTACAVDYNITWLLRTQTEEEVSYILWKLHVADAVHEECTLLKWNIRPQHFSMHIKSERSIVIHHLNITCSTRCVCSVDCMCSTNSLCVLKCSLQTVQLELDERPQRCTHRNSRKQQRQTAVLGWFVAHDSSSVLLTGVSVLDMFGEYCPVHLVLLGSAMLHDVGGEVRLAGGAPSLQTRSLVTVTAHTPFRRTGGRREAWKQTCTNHSGNTRRSCAALNIVCAFQERLLKVVYFLEY